MERLNEITEKDGTGRRTKMNELKALSTVELRKAEWSSPILKKLKSKP